MSGHSKWSSIKHKKAAADAKRGKAFSKLIRAITSAARSGGGNPDDNARLRTMIDKSKGANMPNDTIERAIKKGTGELEGVDLEEIFYEGYGPGGVALYVEVLTDNKNRAASVVRSHFSKGGGKLGASGCTAYLFESKGVLDIEMKGTDEEKVLEAAISLGADDVRSMGDVWQVTTDPSNYDAVQKGLKDQNFSIRNSELTLLPKTAVSVQRGEAQKLLRLLNNLEEEEDVQNVYANFEMDDELLEELENE